MGRSERAGAPWGCSFNIKIYPRVLVLVYWIYFCNNCDFRWLIKGEAGAVSLSLPLLIATALSFCLLPITKNSNAERRPVFGFMKCKSKSKSKMGVLY